MILCAQPLPSPRPDRVCHGTPEAWRDLLALTPQSGLMSESWLDLLLDRIEARP